MCEVCYGMPNCPVCGNSDEEIEAEEKAEDTYWDAKFDSDRDDELLND